MRSRDSQKRPPVELHRGHSRSYLWLKRAIDVCASGLSLIVLMPLWIAVAAAIRKSMGPPILFRQPRLGREERVFTMLKFRTMTEERDMDGSLLPDGDRLTRIGVFLRRTSIDELPELVNVLKGDMSLVGPRPLLLRYAPFFTERERIRHSVRPGITGLAQVNGRNEASWDNRLQNDIRYVESMSPMLDFSIILETLRLVVQRRNVHVNPGAMMQDLDAERADRRAP